MRRTKHYAKLTEDERAQAAVIYDGWVLTEENDDMSDLEDCVFDVEDGVVYDPDDDWRGVLR